MVQLNDGARDVDKKSAGRSLDYPNEPKNPRSIVTTDTGWQGFKDTAQSLGLSASAYVEMIDRNQSVLENPILYRLRSFLEMPCPVLWCLSAAVHRYAQQFHYRGMVDDDSLKGLVKDTLKRAMTITAMIQYCEPDLYLRDLMPLLRWIGFKILLPRKITGRKSMPDQMFTNEQQHYALDHIHGSLKLLAENSPAYYEMLEMEFIGGLTPLQIAKYRRLNTQRRVTEADVRKSARDAISQLRSYLHKNLYETLEEGIQPDLIFALANVDQYIKLCARQTLSGPEILKLESFIVKATQDDPESGKYEFWIRECDHVAGHYWQVSGWAGSIHKSSAYEDVHYEIRKEIEEELFPKDREGQVELRLRELDKELMKAKSRAKITEIIERAVWEESSKTFQFKAMPLPGKTAKRR